MRSKKSFQKQKRRNTTPFFIFILLSPYIVGFAHPDSTNSYSEVMLGIGRGQYVYHDCEGAHTQPFTDAGIYLGRKFEGPYRAGISAGFWNLDGKGIRAIAFPDLALDWYYFSLGTTGVRLGVHDDLYLESKWLDQPPYLSGKGLARFGVGGTLHEYSARFWFGGNVIPYNTLGFAAQIEFPWDENKYLFLNGRLGKDKESNYNEFGVSVGLRLVKF
ncbi:MAG: hypothetical protein AB1728_09665 [Bacteroidota bacterium]